MEKLLVGLTLDVNEDGYLTDFGLWNREVGLEIANTEGVEMTDEHWRVVSFLQDKYRNEVPLTIRRVGKSGVIDIKGFYRLFPNGPLKVASKIAGIPKPVSCI